jgi:hypothetical protein|tara:strand:+ start:410 stop:961 length:552 start_codon:yes stop_codon:yes gene_type:complete
MLEFCYELPYEHLDFEDEDTNKLYRIGRGEQGVLLVRPYTNTICAHWKFRTPDVATKSANKIYSMFIDYMAHGDFVGMDMCRKFLEMGFTRARRYANHHSGTKYNDDGSIKPQESDHWECHYNQSAQIFKRMRDKAAYDPEYKRQRTIWRSNESTYATRVDALANASNVKRTRYSRKRNEVSR